jgi:Fic family protein
MEPMLLQIGSVPSHINDAVDRLNKKCEAVMRSDAELSRFVHPITARQIALLVESMNCYYSNLIEGHGTQPADIERALKHDFSDNKKQRNLQQLSLAHIRVDRLMKICLQNEAMADVCSNEFIGWLHREFYSGMEKAAWGTELIADFTPGKFRSPEDTNRGLVMLGNHADAHVPPDSAHLQLFMARFHQAYRPKAETLIQARLMMAAASHHRLAWIHPFMDGNGRVTRLFSMAYLQAYCNIGEHGLWSLSRGLARGDQYKAMLVNADAQRRGDLDGRGNLSTLALAEFCEYFLDVMQDQINFMGSILDLDGMKERISAYINVTLRGKIKPQGAHLLTEAFIHGEFERGDAGRITGLPERSARDVLSSLISLGLLASDTPKGKVSLRLPAHSLHVLLPGVFPAPNRPLSVATK